ncbi:MAG TPA: MFS transporter [Vicinamibacteria bacterium]|nr:MFS transporter [Vicinamibacteria bacterium]
MSEKVPPAVEGAATTGTGAPGVPIGAPSAPRWAGLTLPAFMSALAYRNFRLLWTGAFLSSIGTWTQDLALSWLIHTRMHDPFYLGLRAFVADAPLLAFMLLGGAVADRVDRRRILLASQVLQMAFATALWLLYATGQLGIGAILLIAALTGLTQSQSAPTYQAVITSLVPPRQIPNAVALNSLQFNLSRAIGPALAGMLLSRAGTGVCFAVNAASFLAVIVALWRLQVPPAPPPTDTLGESLRAGMRHVAHDRLLASLTMLGAAGTLLGFPLVTYLPVIAGDVLGTGAAGYSLLLSSFGAGAILGAVATAHRGHVGGRGRAMLVALLVYGIAATAAMTARVQLVGMALLFVAGGSLVTAFSTLNSLVQENAPPALRGRVLSIYGLAFRGGMPVGSLVAGTMVGPLGAPMVIGGFSAALAVLAVANLAWNSRVRDL